MLIKKIVVGQLAVNCYIVADENTKNAVVVDPGAEGDRILEFIKEEELQVKYVINTHGHIDHISANSAILKATGAELLIHKDDAEYLQNPELNLSFFLSNIGERVECLKADRLLENGEMIECDSLKFSVIHTPGHTPGCICLRIADALFTGDTIFAMGVGRTDFPGGSYGELRRSIDKILEFNEDLDLYPGHGPKTTLNRAKQENLYI